MPIRPLPRVPGYGLAAPTHESIINALAIHFDDAPANGYWTAACAAVGVRRYDPAPSVADLRRVAEHLAASPGLVGVVGRAAAVRLATYAALTAPSRAPSPPAAPRRETNAE